MSLNPIALGWLQIQVFPSLTQRSERPFALRIYSSLLLKLMIDINAAVNRPGDVETHFNFFCCSEARFCYVVLPEVFFDK